PEVKAKEGYQFDGWYEEGHKVETMPVTVEKNGTYLAKISKTVVPDPTPDPTPNPPAVLKPIPVKQVALTASPVTGDTANYQIYLGMFGVLVSGGMIVLIKYRRRKRCQQ
ncbi:MAG: LPXTG cell wall anchor domain-containing protein, partial [Lachnospiraceae bacterium]